MAAGLRIDTFKFVRKLTGAGFDRRQAEPIADGLTELGASGLATKSDRALAASELGIDMRELKTETFRAMLLQAGTIVCLAVALVKLLP